jgi:outer membrane protein OmpA-like peptidoglycan-associated protein
MMRTLANHLLVAVAAVAVFSAGAQAQEGASALERQIAAATYAEGVTVKLVLAATPHLATAAGEAKVKRRRGATDVEVSIEGIQPAMMFGGDFNTYVLWLVTPEGAVFNASEILPQGDKAKQQTSTILTCFGLMITAEPHYLVDKPSSFVILSSDDTGLAEQKDTAKTSFTYSDFVEGYQFETRNLGGPAEFKGLTRSDRHQAVVAVRFAEEAGAQEWASPEFEQARAALRSTLRAFGSGTDEKQLTVIAHRAVRKAVLAKRLTEERRAAAKLADERKLNRETIERLQTEKAAAETAVARLTNDLNQARGRFEKATGRLQDVEREMLEVSQEADRLARERSAAREAAQAAEEQAAGFFARMQNAMSHVAEIRESDRGLVVNLPDVLFASGSSRLQPSAREVLSRIAGVLLVAPEYHLSVEGHTDSTGRTALNQQLSEKRAISVVNYLGRCGISPAMMSMRGYGESRPIASNRGAAGRKQNRRVEIIIEGLTR